MCCSALAQIVYGMILLAVIALTATSLFTPNWRQISTSGTNSSGLFTCDPTKGNDYCPQWWEKLKDFEKVVVIAMILALVVELIALGWNLFSFCACCCKKYVIHPLSGLSLLVAIFLAVAVIVYGVNNSAVVDEMRAQLQGGASSDLPLGYSYFLACGALALSLLNTLIAALAICFADKCL